MPQRLWLPKRYRSAVCPSGVEGCHWDTHAGYLLQTVEALLHVCERRANVIGESLGIGRVRGVVGRHVEEDLLLARDHVGDAVPASNGGPCDCDGCAQARQGLARGPFARCNKPAVARGASQRTGTGTGTGTGT